MKKMDLIALLVFALLPVAGLGQVDRTASTRHVFPQMADGGGFQSQLLAMNVSNVQAFCTYSQHGLTLDRFGDSPGVTKSGTTMTFAMPPNGGWVVIGSLNGPTLQVGYSTLSCDVPVTAQVLYHLAGSFGEKLGFATVFSSQEGTIFAAPFLQSLPQARLGLAIANDGFSAVSCEVSFGGDDGVTIDSANVFLGPRSQQARFLDELVSGIPVGTLFLGSVLVICDGPVGVIGLLFDGVTFTATPLSVFF